MVVRSPCQENYSADAHSSTLKSVLESASPAWTRGVHLDAPGQRHGQQPVSGTADPGVVKQDKASGGSVDTTKTRSDPQRVRMSSGKRPIGAAKGKQIDTEALCQTPPRGLLGRGSWHPGQGGGRGDSGIPPPRSPRSNFPPAMCFPSRTPKQHKRPPPTSTSHERHSKARPCYHRLTNQPHGWPPMKVNSPPGISWCTA